jgi:hypothetical protein
VYRHYKGNEYEVVGFAKHSETTEDRTKNGAGEFDGELIRFGSENFPDWDAVVEYLMPGEGF